MPFILPDPARRERLRLIQKHLSDHKKDGSVGALSVAVSLMLQEPSFQRQLANNKALAQPVSGEGDLLQLAWAFLKDLLYSKDFVAAAMVLFDEETFTGEPECVRLVWEALMTRRMICIIGGGGLGKTFSTCAYFFLEWLSDPEWTRVQVASNSQDHLEKNAWGDLIRLHADASMAMPGKADSKGISLDKKRAQGIFSLILPGGPENKGKLKGSHTKARPAHPVYGRRSRVFCLIDEAQETPQNIFNEIPNRFSSVDGDDVQHIKFVLTANPKQIFSEFGNCAKPRKGWDSITRADNRWESEAGWTVVSLDAMRHENIVQRRKVYPGFIGWDGIQIRLGRCHGNWEDPEMYTYVYGKFPPMGLAQAIIKQNWLTASEREWIFDSPTVSLAGGDPAYTGDRPAIATGRAGRAIGFIDHNGNRHMLTEPAMKVQIDAVAVVGQGDTQDVADNYMDTVRPLRVEPEAFGIDKTGTMRGVHDIIRRQWYQKVKPMSGGENMGAPILGIEFGGLPTEKKIADEDTDTPKQMYRDMATELWFAGAKLFEYDIIGIGKSVDVSVFAELAARQGGMVAGLGKKQAVESKADFKRRTGMKSPDLADALLVLVHVGRVITPNLIPKAKDTTAVEQPSGNGQWQGFDQSFGTATMSGMAGAELVDLQKD